MTPSPAFVRISRNPSLVRVRPQETAREIAFRLRNRIPADPIVDRPVNISDAPKGRWSA